MRRFILLTAVLCAVVPRTIAQPSITAAEYFFDTDPGIGGGTPITLSSPASTVVLSASIPTIGLSPGFHFLAVRSMNAAGLWSHAEARGLYITGSVASAGAVTAAEFFVDTDPGTGLAIPMSVGATGATVNFSATIPTTSLTAGFHFLAIRTRDAAGRWSLFETRGFFMGSTTVSAGAVNAAEFFIDADPGAGDGIPLAIGPSGPQVTFMASIPTTSLAPGFHFLAIRTRDASGRWSLFETRGFYISSSAGAGPAITAAEYFIDTDPGLGDGISLPVGASGSIVNFTASIPTTSLAQGFHFLAIRVRDAAGRWSVHEQRGFYIMPAAAPTANVVRGEYFLDTDPGIGAGTSFTYAAPATSQTAPVVMNIPPGTTAGPHLLVMRVQDAAGKRSHLDTVQIEVTSTPLSLVSLQFGAQRSGNHSLLKWTAVEEPGLKEYRIERSSNGKVFEEIGVQSATGNGSVAQAYRFTDEKPVAGLNFYRLRTINRNGSHGFSTVASVRHGAMGTLSLLPNPAVNAVWLEGLKSRADVRILSSDGKLVKTFSVNPGEAMDVSGLAAGMYWADVLTAGSAVHLSFVKQ